MTDTQTPATPPNSTPAGVAGPSIEPAPFQVAPRQGTKLEQLHAMYPEAKAAADEANEKLKAITDGIKLALTEAAPDAQRIELTANSGAPALRLSYAETWRFDSKRFKAEDPVTYVRYAKKSGSWTLKAVAQGGGES